MILGIIIALFFQCMTALLNPVGPTKGGIKWGLVAHTVAMFSSATVYTAMNLDLQSISYIDNRDFTGDGVLFPGPLGYQFFINSNAITITADVMFSLNGWLADGLLVSSALCHGLELPWRLTQDSPPALPLLCYLCHELLGNRLPMPDVPRYVGYVLDSSAD